MTAAKDSMKQRFVRDDVGLLTEYVSCKVERSEELVKFTHVLLQSFVYKFGW